MKAIRAQLPNLNKKQLTEILFLANGWAEGIALKSIWIEPKSHKQLYHELRIEREKIETLSDENAELKQKLAEYEEYSQNLGESLKKTIKENRWLKSDRYLQPKGGQR